MHSPMEQFEIKRLLDLRIGSLDASYTNSALWMTIAVILATLLFVFGMRQRALIPGRLQAVAELGYEFVAGMVRDNVGSQGKAYFPFILTLFVFILFCNTLGLVPYSFTPTSHIIVTFAMALVVFVGVTIIGFAKNGLHFLQLFAPKGVPVYFLVFVAPLEVFSYFVRPFSLSIRLFANMLAGHTMLKVFGGFAVMLGILAGWAPIVLIFALTGLELIIAFLQAYVFTILTCLYLNDALHPSH
ncbi:F0F1 ATP synthase subunit A [Reyranella sp.]|uniref:F0F1 ATP synthase subunit A n=1 Tax=Reyranella sp. TaxID=1929291 RepID=UPI002F944074